MSIFSKKPDNTFIPNKDYEQLSNRIADLVAEIKVFKAELEAIKTNINSINGRINRTKTVETKQEDLNLEFPFRSSGGGLS